MAAVLLYAYAAFVVHLGFLFSTSHCAFNQCSAQCYCLGSIVDCSKRSLTEVPSDLPQWVKKLDLQANDLRTIPETAFQGLDKLETLTLSHNKLTTIPNLPQGSNLTHLTLSHNEIRAVTPGSLDHLPHLRILEINFNPLSQIPSGAFPLLPNLRQLFLNNNKLSVIEAGAFDNLTSLEWLKLSKNRLSALPKSPNLFSKLTKLKILELNRNRFRKIEGLTFDGLSSLETLKLKRNNISELMDGAFWQITAIESLQLDHNSIGSVTKGWLYGLSSLKQLGLSNNNISRIDADSWEFCKALETLDLTANKLTNINAGTFSKLKALKQLRLNNNSVSFIGPGAFTGLSLLQSLEMNNNEISWTIEDMNGAFDGLAALSRLELDSNRIKSIGKRAFSGLEHLQHLNLNDNAINSIQSNAFSPIAMLQELRLNSSNLLCDCQLSWLPKWLRENGFEETVDGVCAHPENLKGRSIFNIDLNEFECNDYPRPLIRTDPEEQVVLRGSNVTLRCEAVSTSTTPMTVQWKKDSALLEGAEIENYDRTTDGQVVTFTSIVHIRHVTDEAEGTYQCVIINGLGSTYSKKAQLTVHVYPTFTKVPDDVTVRAGTTARLECAARGDPQPEIAWQKDGGDDFPAARERRMHVMPDDEVFFIVSVKSTDQGVYSCTATNAAGTIVANSTVQVLETPAFVKPMEDKTAEEGKTAVLECLASGSPKPKLEWIKDGQPLDVTDRHFFTADDQLLIIVQTKVSDTGQYTCVMTNTLGTDRDNSYLEIISLHPAEQDNAGGLDDESTTTGIIIIAVVCCVVGTSLVWVIIIYQTRKKTEEYSSTPTDETTLPGEGPGTPYQSSDRDSRSSPGPLPPPHLTSSYTNMEDEERQQTVPLTSDTIHLAENSDNSITALHRLVNSDCDTEHSSSPGSRSTHSTGLLHTFHPSPASSQPNIDIVEPCTSATELIQDYSHNADVSSFPQHNGAASLHDKQSQNLPHGSRPPEFESYPGQHEQYPISSSHTLLPSNASEAVMPLSQSLPLPPRLSKDPHSLSRPLPPVPHHNHLHSHQPSTHQQQPQQQQQQNHHHNQHHNPSPHSSHQFIHHHSSNDHLPPPPPPLPPPSSTSPPPHHPTMSHVYNPHTSPTTHNPSIHHQPQLPGPQSIDSIPSTSSLHRQQQHQQQCQAEICDEGSSSLPVIPHQIPTQSSSHSVNSNSYNRLPNRTS